MSFFWYGVNAFPLEVAPLSFVLLVVGMIVLFILIH